MEQDSLAPDEANIAHRIDNRPAARPMHVDVTEGRKKLRRGARLWIIAVAIFKGGHTASCARRRRRTRKLPSGARLLGLRARRRVDCGRRPLD
jgi:hypothetical protein